MAAKSLCSIPGCGKPAWARGWCQAHLYRWRKYGNPLGGRTSWGEPRKFLEDVVLRHSGDECLAWPYTTDQRGYGQIYWEGRVRRLNRLICEIVYGQPPSPHHVVAHSCGKGHLGCCSPRHLSWKTQAENMADAQRHGTWNHGEKVPQSKLKEYEVKRIRSLKGEMLQREIAAMFNTTQSNVSRIHSGETWGK